MDHRPTVSITVDAAITLKVILTKNFFIEKNFETGQEIWLAFKSEAAKYYSTGAEGGFKPTKPYGIDSYTEQASHKVFYPVLYLKRAATPLSAFS